MQKLATVNSAIFMRGKTFCDLHCDYAIAYFSRPYLSPTALEDFTWVANLLMAFGCSIYS